MHPQAEIGTPEQGDGCISITLTDSLWDWSLSILDYAYRLDFLGMRWKAPLLPIVPWSPWFGNEPIDLGFCHLGEMVIV